MKVRDVMSPEVEVLRPNDTLQTAAQLMADLDAAVLPVGEDDDRLIGMITDRDIAMRIGAEGRDPQQLTVRQAMSSDVLYCFEDERVEDVSEKMDGWWIRRMPVVNRDKCLIGTVSLGALTSFPTQR
jgi:CBS domain-containing protein